MNYTTQFPTLTITRETLLLPRPPTTIIHPMNFSRFIHIPTFITTIWLGTVLIFLFSYYHQPKYSYKYSNGITYRINTQTKQTDYLWPKSYAWKQLPTPVPTPTAPWPKRKG